MRGAIVLSAGFKEVGEQGVGLERQILQEARRGELRIIGPNCLGVMNPVGGINATFAADVARAGSVGMVSQSGALLTAILDWSLRENVGFSRIVSLGSMLDVGWGDMIDYLGEDAHTRSIVLYMESIGDARAFLSAAREVALSKPIIVIKAGRTAQAAKAAASHTGSLAGSDEVLDAAFRRCGVLRVNQISELFYLADALGKQPRPRGPRLSIVTNAGGPGVLATDALIEQGGQLAEPSIETLERLNALLPVAWSHGNPIDLLGDADPERYARAVEIAKRDQNADGLLVILTPQAMTDPTQTAERLSGFARDPNKPILASWMGGATVADGQAVLGRAGIPTFPFPDTAAQVFTLMWRDSENLHALYETPTFTDDGPSNENRVRSTNALEGFRARGRSLLTELESKQLLADYGIPTVPTEFAATAEAAVARACAIGFPVVLKLHSETITHKSDVDGVRLNLAIAEAVAAAFDAIRDSTRARTGEGQFLGVTVQRQISISGYELILGSSTDAQFGPVLLFGSGGRLVEVYRDKVLGLPPLNTTLAHAMMRRTRIFRALQGVRGQPAIDLDGLATVMVRFSRLVVEQRAIREVEINPLLATPGQLIALDARVVLFGREVTALGLPRLAIRPYPSRYVEPIVLADETPLTIRPIRPEDEPLMVRFHQSLSESSVYLRYFHAMKLVQRVAHDRLSRICFIDYDRELALVAVCESAGQSEIVAVGRLSKLRPRLQGEFAIVISDGFQHRGLGTELLRRLIRVARDQGMSQLGADILPQNLAMQRVAQKLGFRPTQRLEDRIVRASLDLKANAAS